MLAFYNLLEPIIEGFRNGSESFGNIGALIAFGMVIRFIKGFGNRLALLGIDGNRFGTSEVAYSITIAIAFKASGGSASKASRGSEASYGNTA